MEVAITGGNGFIGKCLVSMHLTLGDNVRILSRQYLKIEGVKVVVGDLTKEDCILDEFVEGVDILYHCAGEVRDESKMYALHVEGTKRLVEIARNRIGRWVQLSSVGAYGLCCDGTVTEESPEKPNNTYEMTKTQADDIVRASGISFAILRPSIVFGETMNNQSLFQLMRMLRKGLFFFIGKPGALVNYVHVEDVIGALYLCATDSRALGSTYNLSQTTQLEHMVTSLRGEHVSGRGIIRLPLMPVKAATTLLGWLPGFPLTQPRVTALTNRCCYSADKILNELDFRFPYTLEERFQSFASTN